MISLLALGTGFLLDLCFGDPSWMPHIVVGMGRLITFLENCFRKGKALPAAQELFYGRLLAAIVLLTSVALAALLLYFCQRISPTLRYGVESFLCFQLLAAKGLKTESQRVCQRLLENDLPGAQKAVARIVGRDTQELNAEKVTKAAVETVAENSSDGVVAPMFFMLLGGAPLGVFYKAVNTMDSMVGYKNQKYLYFGRAAAKLDDLVNFIPARIAGFFMVLSAFLLGFDGKNAWRVFKRDRLNHSSPNSAQTEAACAGALQIQLGGDSYYFGKLVHKDTIGDPVRPAVPEDIQKANCLMYVTSLLCLLCFGAVKIFVWRCLM